MLKIKVKKTLINEIKVEDVSFTSKKFLRKLKDYVSSNISAEDLPKKGGIKAGSMKKKDGKSK